LTLAFKHTAHLIYTTLHHASIRQSFGRHELWPGH
jgi:hypothetical protein